MAKKVLICGGLGQATNFAFAIKDANRLGHNEYICHGLINDRDGLEEIEGFPVVGGLKDIPKFIKQGYYFIYTIFRTDGQQQRIELFESLAIPDDRLAIFVHPTAYVAPNVHLSPGCVVMPNASISSVTTIGRCSRILACSSIGHHNIIGNYCFFASNSCSGSYLEIEDGVTVGLNATIREYVKLGENSAVGMGAVVLNNIGPGEIWAGNPAKFLRNAHLTYNPRSTE
jgi:sugar O-acyltransferase (sialic acid O-acetyltransferase NeuD family)